MKNTVKPTFFGCFLVVASGCTDGMDSGRPDSNKSNIPIHQEGHTLSESDYVLIADAKLESMRVPYSGRVKVVEYGESDVIVSYLVPDNTRGGKYVIWISKGDGKVSKTVIGR